MQNESNNFVFSKSTKKVPSKYPKSTPEVPKKYPKSSKKVPT